MRHGRGMVLLELLATLAAAAFIVLAGSRTLWVFLGQLEQQNRTAIEGMEIGRLENRLRRAWQERCAHPFQEGHWLTVDGVDRILLERFRMRSFTDTGTVGECILEIRNGKWVYGGWETGVFAEHRLDYTGTIQVRIPAREWIGGEEPKAVQWRFPEASTREARSGFVLRKTY